MRHGSLFSGIGGFDLAAQRMGWENVFHCEWNEFGKRVLQYYWPKAISYEDITKTDFTVHRGAIDILTGGFPCQPYSLAGKRQGKEDSRHLWPEMLRAIREISPRWVVGENVRGIVSWNGGMVFDEVQSDLEAEGYEVLPFLLPACAVNAPHRRDRVWFVAFNAKFKSYGRHNSGEGKGVGVDLVGNILDQAGRNESSDYLKSSSIDATHSDGNGQQWSNSQDEVNAGKGGEYAQRNVEQMGGDAANARLQRQAFSEKQATRFEQRGSWECFPTQSPICSGDDGLPTKLDGITFSKWRNESVKAYGNAIVPQVALQIFKAIEAYETTISGPRRVFE